MYILENHNTYIYECITYVMAKDITSIRIDTDLRDKAKARMINISGLTEDAIRQKIGEIDVTIDEPLYCSDCGRKGEKETADKVQTIVNIKDKVRNPTDLVWLYPDERWICNSCLRRRVRQVPVSMK